MKETLIRSFMATVMTLIGLSIPVWGFGFEPTFLEGFFVFWICRIMLDIVYLEQNVKALQEKIEELS